jgi:hypothetical protein
LVASFFAPRDALALGPVTVEAGGQVGGGSNPVGNGGPDPLGFELGARAGASLSNVHLGLSLVYSFGAHSSGYVPPGATASSSFSTWVHAIRYGVDAGYDIRLGDVVLLRPEVGVGNFSVETSTSGTPATPLTTMPVAIVFPLPQNTLYLEPGLGVLVPLGSAFVGADASVLVLPLFAGSHGALAAHAQVGVRF